MTAAFDLDAYFERIRYTGERTPTRDTLRAIHVRHTEAIAFENLNPLLKWPVRLDVRSLEQKIVRGGRGGYCFEQNLLLSHALSALGFRVTGLAARVSFDSAGRAGTGRGSGAVDRATGVTSTTPVRSLQAIRGIYDGGPKGMMVFTVPLTAGFPAIEEPLKEFGARLPGSSWWYEKVFDKHDKPFTVVCERMNMSADEKREFPRWGDLYQEREVESMPWFHP